MAKKDKNLEIVKTTVLNENEEIQYSIFGAYETKSLGADTVKNGVLVATNQRIIFYAKRFTGYDLENFDYSKISTFELSKKLMGNIITFSSSGNKVNIKWVNDDELDDFIEYVNKRMQGRDSITDTKKESSSISENLNEIKQLKELLDMDAITQEEFDLKKKELLNL